MYLGILISQIFLQTLDSCIYLRLTDSNCNNQSLVNRSEFSRSQTFVLKCINLSRVTGDEEFNIWMVAMIGMGSLFLVFVGVTIFLIWWVIFFQLVRLKKFRTFISFETSSCSTFRFERPVNEIRPTRQFQVVVSKLSNGPGRVLVSATIRYLSIGASREKKRISYISHRIFHWMIFETLVGFLLCRSNPITKIAFVARTHSLNGQVETSQRKST